MSEVINSDLPIHDQMYHEKDAKNKVNKTEFKMLRFQKICFLGIPSTACWSRALSVNSYFGATDKAANILYFMFKFMLLYSKNKSKVRLLSMVHKYVRKAIKCNINAPQNGFFALVCVYLYCTFKFFRYVGVL